MPETPVAPQAARRLHLQAETLRALDLHKAGRSEEAAAVYRAIVAEDPGNADALHLLGTLTAQSGKPAEAEPLIRAALDLRPDVAQMWNNYANVLSMLDRLEEAVAACDRALVLAPDAADVRYVRGAHLLGLGRAQAALLDFESYLARMPASAEGGRHLILTGQGKALFALKRYEEAASAFAAAAALAPGNVDALSGRGISLFQLGRFTDAIGAFDRAIELVPGHLDSILWRALAQVSAGKPDLALATMERVIAVKPDAAMAHYIRGHALLARQRTAPALEAFEKAAVLDAALSEAVYNAGAALRLLGRHEEAIVPLRRTLEKEPDHVHALSALAEAAMYVCDWPAVDRIRPVLEAKVREGARGLQPFSLLSLFVDKQLHLSAAETFVRHKLPALPEPLSAPGAITRRGDRIRLGYLTSDARRHAMAWQMAEMFEIHDRGQFDVVGFSGGPDDGSAIRKRILGSFDKCHEVAAGTDEEIARLVQKEGIDILVDMNGHTVHSRILALAWRPAPVQATYLGFPGTSGATFVDYVIADSIVAPFEDAAFYSEKIVQLPGCYQVSDRSRKAALQTPTRATCGLPEDGFVFCCFNSTYKISEPFFDAWMGILKAVPGSVLWLMSSGKAMEGRLRQAAEARGVPGARIVFCSLVEPEVHLARHRNADLFLDTLPYNSHTTGSFSLWAGLPIITCVGETFAGRVSKSMLHAIGLPDLVTASMAEYEALAVKLAGDRGLLDALRRRLQVNRDSEPLFDTDLFRRHIEAAYRTMFEIAARGEQPRGFAVPCLGGEGSGAQAVRPT